MSLLSNYNKPRRLIYANLTSIWLKDVSKVLEKTNTNSYYHGFDISADQFPENPGNFKFSVQDITLPFAKEHWNRYDVVHVRLLVAALEETDYRTAISNLSAILSMSPNTFTFIGPTLTTLILLMKSLAVFFNGRKSTRKPTNQPTTPWFRRSDGVSIFR